MSDDPIVAAVRAVREELSRPLHYDLPRDFCRYAKSRNQSR